MLAKSLEVLSHVPEIERATGQAALLRREAVACLAAMDHALRHSGHSRGSLSRDFESRLMLFVETRSLATVSGLGRDVARAARRVTSSHHNSEANNDMPHPTESGKPSHDVNAALPTTYTTRSMWIAWLIVVRLSSTLAVVQSQQKPEPGAGPQISRSSYGVVARLQPDARSFREEAHSTRTSSKPLGQQMMTLEQIAGLEVESSNAAMPCGSPTNSLGTNFEKYEGPAKPAHAPRFSPPVRKLVCASGVEADDLDRPQPQPNTPPLPSGTARRTRIAQVDTEAAVRRAQERARARHRSTRGRQSKAQAQPALKTARAHSIERVHGRLNTTFGQQAWLSGLAAPGSPDTREHPRSRRRARSRAASAELWAEVFG